MSSENPIQNDENTIDIPMTNITNEQIIEIQRQTDNEVESPEIQTHDIESMSDLNVTSKSAEQIRKSSLILKYIKKLAFPLIVVLLGICGLIVIGISFLVTDVNRNDTLRVSTAAVATDTQKCSEIGVEILKMGGNAVDAAIASALCLGVMRPQGSSIGGGCFMLVSMNGKIDFLDFRERAPSKATRDMFKDDSYSSYIGGKAIAVPGEIKGFFEAHSLYGNLSWSQLFEPNIELAKGFKVDQVLADALKSIEQIIQSNEHWKATFTKNGKLLEAGDICERRTYASTLQKIANDPKIFYEGELANQIIEDIKMENGIMELSDLKNYSVKHREVISSYYHGLKLIGGTAPSSSAIIAFMLNLIEKYRLSEMTSSSVSTYHLIIEALKFGFGHRNIMGDPDFVKMEEYLKNLLDKKYAEKLRQKIQLDKTFPNNYYFVDSKYGEAKDSGTSHVSIIDKDRNAVAMTCSVNTVFGSLVLSPKTGIIFNNHMNDFTVNLNTTNEFGIPPSYANVIEPFKTPMSSMSPLFIMDGDRVKIAIGASGGPTIISSIFQVLLQILDFKQEPNIATNLPRLHHQLSTKEVAKEVDFPQQYVDGLSKYGHEFINVGPNIVNGMKYNGNVQVVQVLENNELLAASDKRKQGVPAGY